MREDYNVQLSYSFLDYNESGEISMVRLLFKDSGNNINAYNKYNNLGIGKMILFRDKDGSSGITTISENGTDTSTSTGVGNSKKPTYSSSNSFSGSSERSKEINRIDSLAVNKFRREQRQQMRSQIQEERDALLQERKQERAKLSQKRKQEIQQRLTEIDSVQNLMQGKNPDGSTLYSVFVRSGGYPVAVENIPEGSVLDKIEPTATDETLEKIKKSFAQKGLEITFEDTKRNTKGLITLIKVTVKNNNSMGSASFEDSKKVPTIYIGQVPLNLNKKK